MPYALNEHDGVIRVTLQGTVSGAELHELITEMEQLVEGRSAWPDSLFDLRGVELTLGITDMMGLARRREATKPPHAVRTAFVADSALLTGFARMFQSTNHDPNVTIEVFSDLEAAQAWLQAPR